MNIVSLRMFIALKISCSITLCLEQYSPIFKQYPVLPGKSRFNNCMAQILNIIVTSSYTWQNKCWNKRLSNMNLTKLLGFGRMCNSWSNGGICHVTLVKNPMIQIVVTKLGVVAMITQRGSFLPYNPMSLNQSFFIF